MNPPTSTDSRTDAMITTIGVLVLLIGTATGNAITMLVMSLIAMACISFAYRKRFSRELLLAIGIGILVSGTLAAAITRFL